MTKFIISFRIKEEGDSDDRYDKLTEEIVELPGDWWADTTSFFIKESSETLPELSKKLRQHIDLKHDILVILPIGDSTPGRISGGIKDQDIFKILPAMKKVPTPKTS